MLKHFMLDEQVTDCQAMLNKDASLRPTTKEALTHEWLQPFQKIEPLLPSISEGGFFRLTSAYWWKVTKNKHRRNVGHRPQKHTVG